MHKFCITDTLLEMKTTLYTECAKIYSTETRASVSHFRTVYFGAYCTSVHLSAHKCNKTSGPLQEKSWN
jgi:hypothetical protein